MLISFRSTSLVILSTILLGCAGLDTRLPEIATGQLQAEKFTQEKLAFTEWSEMSERLLRVGRPILMANDELCPNTLSDIGLKTHALKDYDKRLRDGAQRELQVTPEPTIFQIAGGSPAEKAALRAGDIIRNAKGKALNDSDIYKALTKGESLQKDRDGALSPLRVIPDIACGYRVRLAQSSAVNAYADGYNITITTGMMKFVESDEELALIVGHEMAHNTMGHVRKIIGNYILSGLSTRHTRQFESEADYVGLYYAKRAGYDIENVEVFWRRLALVNPKNLDHAKSHPTFPDRYLRLAAAREEIMQKLENGEPLIPNFISGDRVSKPTDVPVAKPVG